MANNKTITLVLISFFAALTAIFSQISIPVGPVPINLALFSTLIAGGLLGAKNGAISQVIYVLLGAVGVPVFASFSGGFQVLVGPRGGYLIGYIVCAFLVGVLKNIFYKPLLSLIFSMIIGLIACYFLGTIWFIASTKTGVWAALTMCVFPFLLGDVLKIACAVAIVPRLKKALNI